MIKTHQELAAAIKGKSILHLNSLGKDAVLCLEWLNKFAEPGKIVSLMYKFDASWPDDEKYLNYLKKRYPKTIFVSEISPLEINDKMTGVFQSPVTLNHILNKQDYDEFSLDKLKEDHLVKYGCELFCSGMSCYEGMRRAIMMRKYGLHNESRKLIFPIGLMKYKQVIELIKKTGLKIHTSYKFEEGYYDSASYFKMRSGFIARPDFKNAVYKQFPLLALDEYRFEVLFNEKK